MKKFYTACFSLLLCISCSSCGKSEGVTFESEWYVGDYLNEQIISDSGNQVSCQEIKFNEYACLHDSDLGRLIALLHQARIPKKTKLNALEFLRKAFRK